MSTSALSGGWAIRLHIACDWLFWVMTVNVLWYLFSLAGGIVLGSAPATVAAAELTRRRLRGEAFSTLPAFASAWRREFWSANVVFAPLGVALGLLGINAIGFAASQTLSEPPGMLTIGALVVVFSLAAVAVPLYAHYDLPRRSYLVTTSRWMLRNLAHVLLLLVAATVVVTASLILPGLIPFVSLGAWITISTALCIAFFTANDKHVAQTAKHTSPSPSASSLAGAYR